MVLKQKSDTLGALSSGLCLVHCLFTPFLFVIQSHAACCSHEAVPFWWKSIDVLFLVISFFAIQKSVQTTSKKWMQYALWITFLILFIIILNEYTQAMKLPEKSIYVPSLGLVFLHIYNRKYCQCANNTCCANN
ncbi:MerC mercury resistance protein [Tenacibaculum mesophilum]|uniref:MerC domain-containing protein n=1 Tax=Tenacibaculum mesophilum TaxID=104268 RepID=A0ABM7CGZ4_9FLAO|nr:MerC domain-containing protein [Tenacibaculum mesophilum]AZJ33072.1 MerC domain-containing protein [Tenacibaculum mesophilum]QFS28323.1 MerC family mercury resistance protein [Tenacibaculum mesophilum]SHF67983.1 MerC mercury resistance protein [Tenacibaculum mesophilum]